MTGDQAGVHVDDPVALATDEALYLLQQLQACVQHARLVFAAAGCAPPADRVVAAAVLRESAGSLLALLTSTRTAVERLTATRAGVPAPDETPVPRSPRGKRGAS